MLYRIRKPGVGVQLFSSGGETVAWKANGKIWSSLSAFASHLASQVNRNEKMDRRPNSLFRVYGGCTVIELPDTGIGAPKEVPFDVWYNNYFNTSEKFRAARKAEKQATLAKTAEPKQTVSQTLSGAHQLTTNPVTVNKPKGWDVPTKNTIKRVFDQSAKFVPNLTFKGFQEHHKSGETFAIVEISGKSYALLEL